MSITTIDQLRDYLLKNFEDELKYNDFQTIFDEIGRKEDPRKVNPLMRELFEEKLQIQILPHIDRIPICYYYKCEKNKLPSAIPNNITLIDKWSFFDSGITSITIPGTVKEVAGGAFSLCTKLSDITIEEGVEKIGSSAFNACVFNTLTIPNSVKEIDMGAFGNCYPISIKIPSKFKYGTNLRQLGIDPNITKVTFI